MHCFAFSLLSLALAVSAPAAFAKPSSAGSSQVPVNPTQRTWPPYIAPNVLSPDRITVLSAVDAQRRGEFAAVPISHLKAPLSGWKSADQALSWMIDVPVAGDYEVAVLLRATGAPVQISLMSSAGGSVSGPFVPEPRGFDSRSAIPGVIRLAKGRQIVTISATPSPRDAPFTLDVLSAELARPGVRERLKLEAVAQRSDTRWMAELPLAVGVHWTKRTMPRSGPQKSYQEAVAAFDTERFADQVDQTGAKMVYFVTAHADQYLPFPSKALDAILPGRTAKRDLVADLIKSLNKRGIKLVLYYHLGAIEDPAWMDATGAWRTDQSRFFANWQSIIREAGERYGTGLAGWWFDDGALNYYYRNPDWRALAAAAKAGNPQRVIGFNSWTQPSVTEFQDFFTGEEMMPRGYSDRVNHDGSLNGTLIEGGDGKITKGSFAGLQSSVNFVLENNWLIDQRDQPTPPPRFSTADMADTLRKLKAYRTLPIVNLVIYQDGTIPDQSVKALRAAVDEAGLLRD